MAFDPAQRFQSQEVLLLLQMKKAFLKLLSSYLAAIHLSYSREIVPHQINQYQIMLEEVLTLDDYDLTRIAQELRANLATVTRIYLGHTQKPRP